MKTKYPIFIIAGPAGVGKTTVVKEMFGHFPELRSSVTYTTRPKRTQSDEDKIMYYVSEEEFMAMQTRGEFLETEVIHGNHYGTHRTKTEELLATNPVIFNIGVQGVQQIKEQFQDNVTTIFLAPESVDQLIKHMRERGDVTEEILQKRLETAKKELPLQDTFDHIVVNYEGKLDQTVQAVANIITKALT